MPSSGFATQGTERQPLDNFRNPKRLRPKKSYSFTTSRSLLLIGLGTVAASLLSENIGSYHAACGLALTFLGFFWPNVELKLKLRVEWVQIQSCD